MGKKWNIGMKDEGSNQKVLFSEGKHVATITKYEFCPLLKDEQEPEKGVTYSGGTHEYFKWSLDVNGENIDVRTITKGKRWLLKQLLSACGIASKEDDPQEKYSFDDEDVLDKTIVINIVNKDNTFTSRTGNVITQKQSEVNRIEKYIKSVTEKNKEQAQEEDPF